MAHITEPKGIDFIIKSNPLTEKERTAISEYIRNYKLNHTDKTSSQKRGKTTRKKSMV